MLKQYLTLLKQIQNNITSQGLFIEQTNYIYNSDNPYISVTLNLTKGIYSRIMELCIYDTDLEKDFTKQANAWANYIVIQFERERTRHLK